MHLGTVEAPRLGGDWATGRVVLDENLEALTPGVFTVRVRSHPGNDPEAVLTDVVQWIDRSSRCTELGLCLLDVTATTVVGPAEGCWFLGIFPKDASGNDIISRVESTAIESRSCSGTL